QPDFVRGRIYTREYLFDLLLASLYVYGLHATDELLAFLPKMSLQAQALLGDPAAPIFVVGGVRDTQVPIDDLELLINSGSQPREAWINPAGGHMGRSAPAWPDPVIFRQVILPGEVRHPAPRAGAPKNPAGPPPPRAPVRNPFPGGPSNWPSHPPRIF